MPERRLSKPAPPHNPLFAPAICLCVECSRKVLALQCEAVNPDDGTLCGDYFGHRGPHTKLFCTTFQMAEERVRLDGDRP